MHAMKLVKKLLLFLPLFGVVILCNKVIDPANLFRGENYYREIAGILLRGKNVANLTDYNERLLQKYYIAGLPAKKDVVVLGSSRPMLIDGSLFPGQSLFNSSVSGATLEDDIAIYWLYRKKGLFPSTVVIGLDPWLLNKANGQTRYKSIQKDYDEALAYMTGTINFSWRQFFPEKYLQLISPSYFQSAVWLVGEYLQKKQPNQFYATDDNAGVDMIKHADGSISYEQTYREISPEQAHASARQYISSDPVFGLNNFDQLDPDLAKKFDEFINLLSADHVTVLFYFPPYHPLVYDFLASSDKYKIIVEVQHYFENYARGKENIRVVGSYNPADYSLGETDFYGGMHVKPHALKVLFSDKE